MSAATFKYWAFISYSHQDEAWVQWLHRAIETYRVPQRLVGRPLREETVPRRLFPLFRDRDELPSSAELGGVIEQALRQSRNLIVVCSPRSATSRWVNEEIRTFRSLGRSDRIFCLIVDGEPHASQKPALAFTECFPLALREPGPDGAVFEPIAADARDRKDGRANAKLKLVSGLINVGLDELKQREKQRQFWQRVQAAAAGLAVVGMLAGTAQWFMQQRAAREREIRVEQLVESGRREFLEGQHARAAVFLNAAYAMGQGDAPLRFMLGQAMRTVDSVTGVRVHHGGGPVRKAVFSADASRFALIVQLESETVAKIYDATTGGELAVLKNVQPAPRHVQFIGNERLLITGHASPIERFKAQSPSTRIWDVGSPQAKFSWDGFNGHFGLPLSADGARVLIAAPSARGGLEVRSVASGRLEGRREAGRTISAASYSPDGLWIVSSDDQGGVRIAPADTDRGARALAAVEGDSYVSVQFTPKSEHVLGVTAKGDLRFWDVSDGRLRLAYAADRSWISELQFDAEGRRLLTVGAQGYRVWFVPRGSLVFNLTAALAPGASGALSPDGDTLVTADNGTNTAQVWDVQAKRLLRHLDLHTNVVSAAAFGVGGRRLVLASRDGAAETWDTQVNPVWRRATLPDDAASVRFDSSGARLLVGMGTASAGHVEVLAADTGRTLARLAPHAAAVLAAEYFPDPAKLATASMDGTAAVWDTNTAARIARVTHGPPSVLHARVGAGGARLITLTDPDLQADAARAGLWEIPGGQRVAWLAHRAAVLQFAASRDGLRVATVAADGEVAIWDVLSGSRQMTLNGHRSLVSSAVFSRDSQRLLTASWDNSVRIWDVNSGVVLESLENPSLGQANHAAWSPDETEVAISTFGGNVWVWTPGTDKLLTLSAHKESVLGTEYVEGGTLLLSWSIDGTARIWSAQEGRYLGIAAAHSNALSPPAVAPGRVATVARDYRVAAWDISLERRSAESLGSALRCKVPWQLDGLALVQTRPDHAGCGS